MDVDNRGALRLVVAHLVRQGRRRIAFLGGPRDLVFAVDRLEGYRDGLAREGLPYDPRLVRETDLTEAGGRQAMDEILREATPDAVAAASDAAALGALAALRAHGLLPGADVAVVGFDDTEAAASVDPPLSSVLQPIREAGARVARRLVRLLEGAPEATGSLLPAVLVVRASSRRARGSPAPERGV